MSISFSPVANAVLGVSLLWTLTATGAFTSARTYGEELKSDDPKIVALVQTVQYLDYNAQKLFPKPMTQERVIQDTNQGIDFTIKNYPDLIAKLLMLWIIAYSFPAGMSFLDGVLIGTQRSWDFGNKFLKPSKSQPSKLN